MLKPVEEKTSVIQYDYVLVKRVKTLKLQSKSNNKKIGQTVNLPAKYERAITLYLVQAHTNNSFLFRSLEAVRVLTILLQAIISSDISNFFFKKKKQLRNGEKSYQVSYFLVQCYRKNGFPLKNFYWQ